MFFIIYLYILITYPYYEKKLLAFQKNLQAYRTVLLELPPLKLIRPIIVKQCQNNKNNVRIA